MSDKPAIAVDPVLVPLADKTRIAHFFGTDPTTLVKWHEDNGFPLIWSGQGRGRKGYAPIKECRAWVKRRAS